MLTKGKNTWSYSSLVTFHITRSSSSLGNLKSWNDFQRTEALFPMLCFCFLKPCSCFCFLFFHFIGNFLLWSVKILKSTSKVLYMNYMFSAVTLASLCFGGGRDVGEEGTKFQELRSSYRTTNLSQCLWPQFFNTNPLRMRYIFIALQHSLHQKHFSFVATGHKDAGDRGV